MMRSTKIQNNLEEDKFGPKIRHPTGIVCLDVIYMNEKRDKTKLCGAARLYQSILEYSLSDNKLVTDKFRITEICYWIIKHNEDYRDHYGSGSASNITLSNRIRGVSNRVKRYLNNLQQWGLIEQLGVVAALTNNGLTTKLYHFTDMGYVVAWILEYQNAFEAWIKFDEPVKLERLRIAKREIFNYIQLVLRGFQSYMTDFLARFYTKCFETDFNNFPLVTKDEEARKLVEWGISDHIIITLIRTLASGKFHCTRAIEYLSIAQSIVMEDKKTGHTALSLFLKALDELPNKTRKMIIAHEKTEIESRFVISQPSKDWETLWFQNMEKIDTLVLYGICQNKECKRRYRPVLIRYRLYRKRLVASTTVNYGDGFDPTYYFIGDCQVCNKKDSLYVFDSYSSVRRHLNKILQEEHSN